MSGLAVTKAQLPARSIRLRLARQLNNMPKITTTEIILRYLNSIYPKFSFNYEIMSRQTPFGFISHKADARLRDLANGYGDKNCFTVKGGYHGLNYELEGGMVQGKRVYRARLMEAETDLGRLFKSIPAKFTAEYCNLGNIYNKWKKAKTDNDKKRLKNEFMFIYKKMCP